VKSVFKIAFAFIWPFLGSGCHLLPSNGDGSGSPGGIQPFLTRQKYKQPFASTSIWNMPIGRGAVYKPANIPVHTYTAPDADVIVMTPDDTEVEVYTNNVGWSSGDRCRQDEFAGFSVPVPVSFVVPDERPATPNSSGAFLLKDGRTLVQMQPIARCVAGGRITFTAGARYPDVDLYGDGTEGAHGGSGLSSIGGTIRLGELVQNAPPVRHALKINLDGMTSISSSWQGFRWPAKHADSCAPGCYKGQNPDLRMGALLALPPGFDRSTLETEPARSLAWTLENYGAYLVDNSGWSCYYFAFERSPEGSAIREFTESWGFTPSGLAPDKWSGSDGDMESVPNPDTPWGRDMIKIFSALQVIDNNGPESIGGGGAPLQPLAPPIN
jgi:hypothetical protein